MAKDPRADRKAVQQAPSVPTMESCIGQYTALMAARWSPSTQRQWRASRLSTPAFLAKPVTEVATADIVDVLHERTPVMRARIIKQLETIFDWLIATGVRQEPNPARFKLGHYLQQPKLLTVHHAAIPWSDLPAYMRTLRERESFAAACLALQILTAVRPGEAREAAWSEIDDEAALWTIPASRMKARQEHRVPLAPQAVELLRRMAASNDLGFYISRPGRPAELENRGKDGPARRHGARVQESFSCWAADQALSFEVTERCLAHGFGDATSRSYRRTDLFEQRRELMQRWADFLDGGATS
jgi:integrase